jgi:hypothetical protein
MKLSHRLLLTFFLLCGVAGAVQAQDRQQQQVVDVDVTIYMIDIDEINSVAQSFKATVYAEFKWTDPELAHPGPDSISKALSEIWYPQTQILNQQRLVDTFPRSAEVRPNGEVIFRQRVWGDFSQSLELRDFPFDTQQLHISLVNVKFGSRQVRYHINPGSGVSENLRIPDWQVRSWEVSSVELPIGQDKNRVGAVVLTLEVERYASYFLLKVILPLILIVAMSWMVFWIDPSMAASQISVAVTAMLTLIAYRFAIGGMVPRLGFLTSLDYFVMGSTVLVFVGLLEVVWTARLYQSGQQEKARAVDKKARWIIPLIYLFIVIETLYLRLSF